MTARKHSGGAFTKRAIDGILAAAKRGGRNVERGDSHDHAGLRFRATPAGKGTWFYRFRDPDGALRLTKLGDWPDMGLADARSARDALARQRRAHGGLMPDARATGTVRDLVDAYVRHISRPGPAQLRTHVEVRRTLERNVVPELGDRPAAELTRSEVQGLIIGIRDRPAPRAAAAVFAHVRRMFNWAIERGDFGLEASPCDRLKLARPGPRRDRWLTPVEIRRLLRGAPSAFSPTMADVLEFLLRTGQRVSEVSRLPWTEIDLEGATWHLPASRSKNGHAHEVPLPDQALEILRRQPSGPWLFRGYRGRPLRGVSVSDAWRQHRGELDLEDTTPHTLRHTVLTHLAKMGCPRDVRERIANHRSVRGAADLYDHHARDREAREWLERWNDELDRLTGLNVVEARRA